MTYIVEIELPNSHKWFKYFFGITSREEAERICGAAEEWINAKIRQAKWL